MITDNSRLNTSRIMLNLDLMNPDEMAHTAHKLFDKKCTKFGILFTFRILMQKVGRHNYPPHCRGSDRRYPPGHNNGKTG